MSGYRVLLGDCRETLAKLPAGSVHCCVTSPPYWGLRDYGHDDQLGLEPTPEEYAENLVGVMREVRRVLRDDGTLWLVLGDSYASAPRGNKPGDLSTSSLTNPDRHDRVPRPVGATSQRKGRAVNRHQLSNERNVPGLKRKDLCMIPARVALALQADGWWLRQDNIWWKKNVLPESVTDRTTSAHEHVFLLAKSERYFYDADAIAEPLATDPSENYPARARVTGRGNQGAAAARGGDRDKSGGFPPRKSSGNVQRKHGNGRGRPGSHLGASVPWTDDGSGTRNARNVWRITTKPYSRAHFAVFPPELAERCILAGTSQKGCCPECGAPWERETDSEIARGEDGNPLSGRHKALVPEVTKAGQGTNGRGSSTFGHSIRTETIGWAPTCDHDREPVPCTVLDPFAGSGTTGSVAVGHGRDAVLCELSDEYVPMIRERCGPMFEREVA